MLPGKMALVEPSAINQAASFCPFDASQIAHYLVAVTETDSKRHHWWPECVSKRWVDQAGGVHWLLPDGSVRRAQPAAFGVIGNGHVIKLRTMAGSWTAGENFEREFQRADDRFPAIIDWLEGLNYDTPDGGRRTTRFGPQPVTDGQFGELIESLVSLAIRSPMTRHCAVSVAEQLRGPLPERERNGLITMNMRHMHRRAVRSLGVRGKATAIYSPEREFIFGDGFYHNLISPSMPPSAARILAPLTPRLAVLYAVPTSYMTEPRLSTLVVDPDETDSINEAVQVYAREALFYRNDKPTLIDDFRVAQHRRYNSSRNVIELIVHDMPGVPPRDQRFDFLDRRGGASSHGFRPDFARQ